jgi:hypothetical protein
MSWYVINYFYEIRSCIMVFPRMFQWTQSQATRNQTISWLPISLSSILISPAPSLGLLSGLSFQVFQLKNSCEFVIALIFAKYLVKTTVLVQLQCYIWRRVQIMKLYVTQLCTLMLRLLIQELSWAHLLKDHVPYSSLALAKSCPVESSQVKSSRIEYSIAESSRAEPSRAESSRVESRWVKSSRVKSSLLWLSKMEQKHTTRLMLRDSYAQKFDAKQIDLLL